MAFKQRTVVDESGRLYAAAKVRRQYDNQHTANLVDESNRQISILQNNATALTNEEQRYLKQFSGAWEAVNNLIMSDVSTELIREAGVSLAYNNEVGEGEKDKGGKTEKPEGKGTPPTGDTGGGGTETPTETPTQKQSPLWFQGVNDRTDVGGTERRRRRRRDKNPKIPQPPKDPGGDEGGEEDTPPEGPAPPKPTPIPSDTRPVPVTPKVQPIPISTEPGVIGNAGVGQVTGSTKVPLDALSSEVHETLVAQGMVSGATSTYTMSNPNTNVVQKQLALKKAGKTRAIGVNTAIAEAQSLASALTTELAGRNQEIRHVRMSDGSIASGTIADFERMGKDNPEYYAHAIGLATADKRMELHRAGFSKKFIEGMINPIHQRQIGQMLTKYNTAWAWDNANETLLESSMMINNAFQGGMSRENKVGMITGALAKAEGAFFTLSKLPGGDLLWKKARTKWLSDRRKHLSEVMFLQGGISAAQEVNETFAAYKVQVPWKSGWVELAEAYPEQFGRLVMAKQLQEFANNDFNQTKATKTREGTKEWEEIRKMKGLSELDANDPNSGYVALDEKEYAKRIQRWRINYAHWLPNLAKTVDDAPYIAKGHAVSLTQMEAVRKSRTDPRTPYIGGYVTREEINRYGWSAAAVAEYQKKHGKHSILDEEWDADLAEGEFDTGWKILEAEINESAKYADKNKVNNGLHVRAKNFGKKILLYEARNLWLRSKGTDEELTKAGAIEEAAIAIAGRVIEARSIPNAEKKRRQKKGLGPKSPWEVTATGGFNWFKDRGIPTMRYLASGAKRDQALAEVLETAVTIVEEGYGTNKASVTNTYIPGIPTSAWKNNSRGEINPIWNELRDIQISVYPEQTPPSAVEIAEEQAKLRNQNLEEGEQPVEFEQPINWEQYGKPLHQQLQNHNAANVNPRNSAQLARSLEKIRTIEPRVFRRSIFGKESDRNYQATYNATANDPALGAYGLLWSNVQVWAPEIGEPIPSSKQAFLNNPQLQDRLFDHYSNKNLELIKSKGGKELTHNVAIRQLASMNMFGPTMLTGVDADGIPLWRSPTHLTPSGQSMQDYTQQALDRYRNGGLIVEF